MNLSGTYSTLVFLHTWFLTMAHNLEINLFNPDGVLDYIGFRKYPLYILTILSGIAHESGVLCLAIARRVLEQERITLTMMTSIMFLRQIAGYLPAFTCSLRVELACSSESSPINYSIFCLLKHPISTSYSYTRDN